MKVRYHSSSSTSVATTITAVSRVGRTRPPRFYGGLAMTSRSVAGVARMPVPTCSVCISASSSSEMCGCIIGRRR